MRLLLGLLAVAANAAVLVGLALMAPQMAPMRDQVLAALHEREIHLTLIVASVATAGSLYLSEIAHLLPCRLCWYQRIAMYPLVVILVVAVWRKDRGSVRYVAPIALIGTAISTYHYLIQRFPGLDSGSCGSGVSCSAPYFEQFGLMSIPYMAGSAFALILALMWSIRLNDRSSVVSPSVATTEKEN